jgi:SAM-dependent methyltransferase
MLEQKPGAQHAPRCPLCRGAAAHYCDLPHTTVYRCRRASCDLQFSWPQLDEETLARTYTELYYPSSNGNGHAPQLENTPAHDAEVLLRHIETHWRPLRGAHLLDYGCGRGTVLHTAQRLGANVAGIETDPVARAAAAALTAAPLFPDIVNLESQNSSTRFDIVVLCTVIEHLREPWTEVAALRRLLAPGGILVATTMNTSCLKARLAGARWDQRANPTHIYYFDEHSLEHTLRRAGFAAAWPLPPITAYSHHGWARRTIQQLLGALDLQGGIMVAASDQPQLRRN